MAHWFAYCFGEALASLWRQKVSVNPLRADHRRGAARARWLPARDRDLERAVSRWSAAAEFSVYLSDDISREQRVALNMLLAATRPSRPRVRLEGDAALRFRRDFPDLAAALPTWPQNPLPASIEVRLNPPGPMRHLEAFAKQLIRPRASPMSASTAVG